MSTHNDATRSGAHREQVLSFLPASRPSTLTTPDPAGSRPSAHFVKEEPSSTSIPRDASWQPLHPSWRRPPSSVTRSAPSSSASHPPSLVITDRGRPGHTTDDRLGTSEAATDLNPDQVASSQFLWHLNSSPHSPTMRMDPPPSFAAVQANDRRHSFTIQVQGRRVTLRPVPQQTRDPNARRRPNAVQNGSVVLHSGPYGISAKDIQRVSFDLVDYPVGSGICMSLLDQPYFEGTRPRILNGEDAIYIYTSTTEQLATYVVLEIKWPTYPETSRIFGWSLALEVSAGTPVTRAGLAAEIVSCFRHFMLMARAEEPTPGQPQYTFGPNALTLDKMWLVSLFQMSGQYFFAEVRIADVE